VANLVVPKRITVAFHPFGSPYSIKTLDSNSYIDKNIPYKYIVRILKFLIQYGFSIFIVGSLEEIEDLQEKLYKEQFYKDNEIFITFCGRSIVTTCKQIALCDSMIGSDSFAKTVSGVCDIPTMVFLSPHEDPYRDQVFITPFVKRGTMQTTEIVYWSNDVIDNGLTKFITHIITSQGKNLPNPLS
jgi:ADP-heptose:LPS heptosyltransferase